jgi:hypothetical protein
MCPKFARDKTNQGHPREGWHLFTVTPGEYTRDATGIKGISLAN